MKSRKFWIALIVLALIGGGFFIYRRSRPPATNYRETTITRGDLAVSILSTGTVQPQNRLEIKPPIAGRVEEILVREGENVKKGQVLGWMSSTERAAMLDAARAQGGEEMKRWEALYRPTPVIAPIDGTIILRNVESGQTFTATDAILVMSNRLIVKAQVDETDLAQIRIGQPAIVILDAYPAEPLPSAVVRIAYEAKTVNNVTTYVVEILPKRVPEFMRSGMTTNITFTAHAKKDVLLAPTDALKVGPLGTTVLTRGLDAKTLEVPVQLGISDGKHTEITSGLAAGTVVLTPEIQQTDAAGGSSPFNLFGGRPKSGSRPRPGGAK